jgi:hypothetical protein
MIFLFFILVFSIVIEDGIVLIPIKIQIFYKISHTCNSHEQTKTEYDVRNSYCCLYLHKKVVCYFHGPQLVIQLDLMYTLDN